MQQLQPNTILQGGKYRIERVLGQGGFGITYLAIQTSLQRQVAIKEFFMKDFCSRDEATRTMSAPSTGSSKLVEQYRKKFIKEARNLARLNHPHIISVIDVFEENGTVYYVMPYLIGGSLQDYVKTHGTLSEQEAMKYVKQIASALKYMHEEQHICHYDVKPANILLDNKGNAVLIDFGISKNYDAQGQETTTTPIGMSEGYAPIEQYQQNVEEFSPVSDVYALGATLYFLLHGKRPVSAVHRASGTALLMSKQISQGIKDMINASMRISKRERANSVDVFMGNITTSAYRGHTIVQDDESTILENAQRARKRNTSYTHPDTTSSATNASNTERNSSSSIGWIIGIALACIVGFLLLYNDKDRPQDESQNLGYSISSDGTIQFNISDDIHFNMKYVKAGTFNMGATPEITQFDKDERPVHEVTLTNDFYIGETEVTQALWTKIMGNNPSPYNKKGDNLPVNSVSWNDCQNFLKKLNSITGYTFRLPTEAEWEYAARGGNQSKKYMYSGSNNWGNVAWCGDNTQDTPGSLQKVKTLSPNELGIYDMSGNVSEWCQDWYGLYSSEKTTDPTGPASGDRRICRGGDIGLMPIGCTVSCRGYRLYPNERYPLVGIRLAASR